VLGSYLQAAVKVDPATITFNRTLSDPREKSPGFFYKIALILIHHSTGLLVRLYPYNDVYRSVIPDFGELSRVAKAGIQSERSGIWLF